MKNELFEYGRAICYSGYRENQYPWENGPSKEEILEDLKILVNDNYKYIRMYGIGPFEINTLQVIKENQLPIKVMLGLGPVMEIYNYNCAWITPIVPTDEEFKQMRKDNDARVDHMIQLAHEFENEIFALSIGNENTPDWGSNTVSEERLIEFAKKLQENCKQPVTFNEGFIEWEKLDKLGNQLDFISVHIYPAWHQVKLENAIQYTIDNYNKIANKFPNKPTIITELGWPTSQSGQMIKEDISEEKQKYYNDLIVKFADDNKVVTFLFEAFDEPWKGGNNPLEPEKHWGIYKVDRTPKLFAKK